MLRRAMRRRWLRARLRELDRLDVLHGKGSVAPPGASKRIRRVPTWLTAGITIAIFAGLFVVPGVIPTSLKRLVGIASAQPLGHPPAVTGSGPHAFLQHQPGSKVPVAWDPCRPIHYRVNVAGGPRDGVAMVAAAVDHVSAATGLRFVYDGRTDDRPHWDSPFSPRLVGGAPPVLISWATADEVHELAGKVAGIGGAVARANTGEPLRYVSGGVTLDSDAFAMLEARSDGRAEERAIVLHELGHLVGLAHVHDRRELMDADNVGVLDFAAGDRAGLARLGRGPCL